MRSKKLFLGLFASPLATSVTISAFAILLVTITLNESLRDAANGIHRLLIFSTFLSYAIVIVVGIPLSILSIRHQWRKLWQNSLAGFFLGLGLGVVIALIMSILPSFKWIDPYSPFITMLFIGLVGSATMTTLWPFIEHNNDK